MTTTAISTELVNILGVTDHPLLKHARIFETNLQQRDDVIIAMASRAGIFIPPIDFGDERAFYTDQDGQYVVREYSRRLLDVARDCSRLRIDPEEVRQWILFTSDQVAQVLSSYPDITDDIIDDDSEYYLGRLPLLIRVLKEAVI